MTDLIARTVVPLPLGAVPAEKVVLSLDDRQLRRRRIVTESGLDVLVDLPSAVTLLEGEALQLTDGRLIAIVSAEEDLIEVRAAPGAPLHRLAWHIGNRHAPCQIEAGRLVIRRDRVLREMLQGLGADLRDIRAGFHPEGGAYGGHPTGNHGGHSH